VAEGKVMRWNEIQRIKREEGKGETEDKVRMGDRGLKDRREKRKQRVRR
jgi:hypothetical protein